MSLFREQLAADAAAAFLNPEEFGEDAVYHRGGAAGMKRTIIAVVNRNPPKTLPETRGISLVNDFLMSVANSSATGISLAELDTGLDTVELFPREGAGVRKTYRIVSVDSQDAGILVLRVR